MLRSLLSGGIAALILLGGAGWPAPRAAAQSVLKRLEQEIRRRVAEDRPAAEAESPPERRPGYLGAVVDDRQDLGRGARVLEVRPEGPADAAGLRQGDLITGAAGVRVRQTDDLADILAVFPAGSRVTLDVLRDGRVAKIDVVLGQRDSPAEEPLPPPEAIPPPLPDPPADPVELPDLPPPPEPEAPSPDAEGDPAAEPPTPEPNELERLRARIAELERRVEQLERAIVDAIERQ